MELSKKTTILFSPQLHKRLTDLAALRGTSLGELVREACEARFGLGGSPERVAAAHALAAIEAPLGAPTTAAGSHS